MKFKRAGHRNSTDEKGQIFVKIMLEDGKGKVVKGNLIRSIRIADTRVNEVYTEIEKALFG